MRTDTETTVQTLMLTRLNMRLRGLPMPEPDYVARQQFDSEYDRLMTKIGFTRA